MTAYEKYTFFLCLIVFVALTALFTALMTYVVRLTVRLIRHGAEDEKILKEYQRNQEKNKKCGVTDWIARAFTCIVCIALFSFFVFSVLIRVNEDQFANRYGSLKVVKSGSMAYQNEKNGYLVENGLNDQLQMMDLVVTEPLPNEFDLELYDIVVYEQDGKMIIHRIVGIEEPNEKHPDERYFKLQGDAVEISDRYPVRYSQMRAIYRGDRVPFVGSFVAFMQSPAGWLCILLVLFSIIATPLVEKKITVEKEKRIALMIGKASIGSTRYLCETVSCKQCRKRAKRGICRQCALKNATIHMKVSSLSIDLNAKTGKAVWLRMGSVHTGDCTVSCKKRDRA